MTSTKKIPVDMMTTREKVEAGIEVTPLERIDVKIALHDEQIDHARKQTTYWQRERRSLTDERYALVKARQFIAGEDES